MIYVYKVTSPNNKVYVGITNDFEHRVSQHIKDSKNARLDNYKSKFKTAIRKYSPENMLWEVIDEAKDYETAHELEKRYVLYFNSYKAGYNMTLGGDGACRDFEPYRWTKEKVLEEASKYDSKPDWYDLDINSYLAAKRLGIIYPGLFEECISNMTLKRKRPIPINFKWTKELVKETCLAIPNNEDLIYLKLNIAGGYSALNRFKKQDINFYYECTDHLIICGRTCSMNDLRVIAKKYTHQSDWEKDDKATYELTRKSIRRTRPALYKELMSHLVYKNHVKWTKDDIILEARKYKTRCEMKANSGGAYVTMNTLAKTDPLFLIECIKHMGDKKNGTR